MKVRGIKKLNRNISKTLKTFGIASAELSDTYAFIRGEDKIVFKITENEIEDIMFHDFIKERFNFDVNPIFLASLLHEIGHYKTDDDISDAVYTFCADEKERITKEMKKATTEEEAKKLQWQYFNLPDEMMATAWAVDFMKNHPEEVKKVWNEIHITLTDFYKKNLTIFEED